MSQLPTLTDPASAILSANRTTVATYAKLRMQQDFNIPADYADVVVNGLPFGNAAIDALIETAAIQFGKDMGYFAGRAYGAYNGRFGAAESAKLARREVEKLFA